MKKEVIFDLIFGFIIILISANFISASGLQWVSNNTINANKSIGTNQDILITIKNNDIIPFYNITTNTPAFSMTKIPVLNPGEQVNVTLTTSTDENFNGQVRIVGYYLAQIGASNMTVPIDINWASGPVPCQLTLIKGDSIVWHNIDTREIEVWNSDVNSKITTIGNGSSYTQKFDVPVNFNYYLKWLAYPFGYCNILVLPDTGFITNHNLDAIVNLSINVDYKQTTLEVVFINTNYSMDVFTTDNGFFSVKNTGTEIAKNVSITGSWISATPNNFDLLPGKTEVVQYKISPFINATIDTNKSYQKQMSIKGNFPPKTQNLTIFINYADFSSNTLGYGSLEEYLKKFCEDNPSICGGGTKVVYQAGNESANLSQEQFRAIMSLWWDKFEAQGIELNWIKEQLLSVGNQSNETAFTSSQTAEQVKTIQQNSDSSFKFTQMLIVGFCFFIIVIGGGILIILYKRKAKENRLRRW